MGNRRTVLFVEWSTRGRDFEITLPLVYFFERYLGWETAFVSIFNLPKLLTLNPDMVIMSNTTGAIENVRMSRIIEKSSIPLFSHVSEGMFRENEIEEFVWGLNKEEKRFSEVSSGVWSKKSFNMAVKAFPELDDFYHVTGAVGFDKYSIYSHEKLDTGKYAKVIGYAAFDFNNIRSKKDDFIRTRGEGFYKKIMDKAHEINEILRFVIQKNPDVLFLLKSHPGDHPHEPIEFKGLSEFDNIKYIGKDVGIVPSISTSDIWLNYNSTTNLEGWLLNKPTISFNTEEALFSSDILHGSITETDKFKIQGYIEEFYREGKIDDFDTKDKLRQELVSDYIGFADGMNHVRFMSFLKKHINMINEGQSKPSGWNISMKMKLRGYFRHGLLSLAKKYENVSCLERWRFPYSIFDAKDFENKKELLYRDFDRFYVENEEQIKELYEGWNDVWKDELGIHR